MLHEDWGFKMFWQLMNSFDSQVLQVASSAPFLGLAQEAFEALGPKTPRWKLSFEVGWEDTHFFCQIIHIDVV